MVAYGAMTAVLFLKLVGHAIGSAALYGVLLMAGFLIVLLAALAWAKITGDEDVITEGAKRWPLAILPGVVVLLGAAAGISYFLFIEAPPIAARLGGAWSKAVEAAIIALVTQ